jgi:hypothetical protein
VQMAAHGGGCKVFLDGPGSLSQAAETMEDGKEFVAHLLSEGSGMWAVVSVPARMSKPAGAGEGCRYVDVEAALLVAAKGKAEINGLAAEDVLQEDERAALAMAEDLYSAMETLARAAKREMAESSMAVLVFKGIDHEECCCQKLMWIIYDMIPWWSIADKFIGTSRRPLPDVAGEEDPWAWRISAQDVGGIALTGPG